MHESVHVLAELRPLRDPVVLAAFGGFSDSGGAAVATLEFLVEHWDAQPVAELDSQPYYDFTVQRPQVRLVDGQRELEWPSNRFYVASPEGLDRDVVMLIGEEPHLRWRTFTEVIAEVLEALGASMSLTIAAQAAAVPHTRPLPVTISASDTEFEEQFGLKQSPSRYQGPTGIVGVLNVLHRERGWRNASLWVQVSHYLSVGPDPNAILSLVRVLDRGFGLATDLAPIEAKQERFAEQVEEAMQQSTEVQTYITSLEEAYDANRPALPEASFEAAGADGGELPTSEELLSDLEDFLRKQQQGDDS